MAKKIIVNNPEKASKILKQGNIEHVLVKYPGKKPNTKGDAFLVVKNKDKNTAVAVLTDFNKTIPKEKWYRDCIHIHHTKSVRHYEKTALMFDTSSFVPVFECTCRNCGKTFKHPVKEAVWCSTGCRKEFYNKRSKDK